MNCVLDRFYAFLTILIILTAFILVNFCVVEVFYENLKINFMPLLNRQKLASNYFLGNLTKCP